MSDKISTRLWITELISLILKSWFALLAFLIISFIIGFLSKNLLAGISVFLILLFLMHIAGSFIKRVLKENIYNPSNLLDNLDYDILKKAKSLTPNDLLLATTYDSVGQRIWSFAGADLKTLRLQIEASNNHPNFDPHNLVIYQKTLKRSLIDVDAILLTLLQLNHYMEDYLNPLDLSKQDFTEIIQLNLWEFLGAEPINYLTPEGILKGSDAVGRSWNLGHTEPLERITRDVSEGILGRYKEIPFARVSAVNDIIKNYYTGRPKNYLILGKNGTGRKTLIENLAYHLRLIERNQNFDYTRVMELKWADLAYNDAIKPEDYLLRALNVAIQSGNIVLVINKISELLKLPNSGMVQILENYWNSPRLRIIAIDNVANYHTSIKGKTSIDETFTKINLDDLEGHDLDYVVFREVARNNTKKNIITYKAVREAIKITTQYLPTQGQPGKVIDLLKDSRQLGYEQGSVFITSEMVRTKASSKINVNLNQMESGAKKNLVTLLDNLKLDVIGQDLSLEVIVNSLKRSVTGLSSRSKPIGTYLLLGTTGVGKTETAKALAKYYFGGGDKIIRIDLNNFSTPESVIEITGGDSGGVFYESALVKQVQDKPASIILLDEIEKAHKNVLNTFLQILDEGVLTDASNQKTSFKDTIILATSNAGAIFIRDFLFNPNNAALSMAEKKRQLLDELVRSGFYSPEFLNRFDEILIYSPLDLKSAYGVAGKMLKGLVNEIWETRGIEIILDGQTVSYLAQKGYSPDYGAREMKRIIKSLLESYLADYFLTHNVNRGDKIFVTLENIASRNA